MKKLFKDQEAAEKIAENCRKILILTILIISGKESLRQSEFVNPKIVQKSGSS